MSDNHFLCRGMLRAVRIAFKKEFGKSIKLNCSKMKISNCYIDYEVRQKPTANNNFPKVISNGVCCSYDTKAKALYNLLDLKWQEDYESLKRLIDFDLEE